MKRHQSKGTVEGTMQSRSLQCEASKNSKKDVFFLTVFYNSSENVTARVHDIMDSSTGIIHRQDRYNEVFNVDVGIKRTALSFHRKNTPATTATDAIADVIA